MLGNILKLGGYALLAREAVDFASANQHYREREQHRREVIYSVSGTLAGLVVGVGIGLLFAPRPGKETREMVAETAQRQSERLQSGLAEGVKQAGDTIAEKVCEDEEDQPQKAGTA